VLPGEIVGLSGLEQAYDARLAGRPGLLVQAVKAGSKPGRLTLYKSAGRPGRPLRTTLELGAQQAADTALAGVKQSSALLALRISSGSVIAVTVGPDPGGYDTALLGKYPPGSTFKVITALALLEHGLKPNDTVDCPPAITVDGKRFHNTEREALGLTSFANDFARSCNTAFASLAPRVTGKALPAAARAFGIGNRLHLGVPAFAGIVPVATSQVELAAEAFGQGRILVSPVAMASVAAAVSRGRWRAPRLVVTARPTAPLLGPRLPQAAVATLRTLMRQVVTSGTGTALATQPGPPVFGKTGTAEIGDRHPPRTDAWFIGYQGDIAFAALVADTHNGFGGTVTAPIIARFLTHLHSR
jgi:cell division protein FtsI/penicillin-binding protein 2